MTADVLRRAKAALESRDTGTIITLYADDAVFDDASSGETYRGKEELRRMFQDLFTSPGAEFSDVVVHEGKGWAAIEWVWSGTKRGTGARFRVRGVSILELRGDKVARETIYYDPRPALA